MSANNNVLVWVPGSFAPAAVYDDFRELLHKNGIQTEVVATPSVGRREGKPPGTVTDDVEAIEQVVNSVLAEGKQPIVLAHSYGGIPTTESMKTLAAKNRDGKGVEKIIYLTAVVLPVGMSSFDMQGGTTNLPEYLTYAEDYMTLDLDAMGPTCFSDLPQQDAVKYARKMSEHSTPSFHQKLSYGGYSDVDVHYIVCEADKIIPPPGQLAMVDLLKNVTGKEPGVHKINSDHCPTHSHPDELLKILKDIVGT